MTQVEFMCNLLRTQWCRDYHLYNKETEAQRGSYFAQGHTAGEELALHLAPTLPAPPSPVLA